MTYPCKTIEISKDIITQFGSVSR